MCVCHCGGRPSSKFVVSRARVCFRSLQALSFVGSWRHAGWMVLPGLLRFGLAGMSHLVPLYNLLSLLFGGSASNLSSPCRCLLTVLPVIMRDGPVLPVFQLLPLLLRCLRRRPVMGHCFRCLLHLHILMLSPHRADLALAPVLLLGGASVRDSREEMEKDFSHMAGFGASPCAT